MTENALTVGRLVAWLGYNEPQVRGLLAEVDPAIDRLHMNPAEPVSRETVADMIAMRTGGTRTINKLAELLR